MAEGKSYDYVIVGAGSAGCVLAHRLTADPPLRVLLLEAGARDTHPLIHIPIGLGKIWQHRMFDWGYDTESERRRDTRRIEAMRGKVLGGSSSIDVMAYVRGHRGDYDRWAESCGREAPAGQHRQAAGRREPTVEIPRVGPTSRLPPSRSPAGRGSPPAGPLPALARIRAFPPALSRSRELTMLAGPVAAGTKEECRGGPRSQGSLEEHMLQGCVPWPGELARPCGDRGYWRDIAIGEHLDAAIARGGRANAGTGDHRATPWWRAASARDAHSPRAKRSHRPRPR